MTTIFLLILSLPLIAVALRSSQTLVYTVSLFPYSSPLRGEVTRHGESYPHLSLAKQVSFPCRFRPGLPALLAGGFKSHKSLQPHVRISAGLPSSVFSRSMGVSSLKGIGPTPRHLIRPRHLLSLSASKPKQDGITYARPPRHFLE